MAVLTKNCIDLFYLNSNLSYHNVHRHSAHCILDKSSLNGADSTHARTDGSCLTTPDNFKDFPEKVDIEGLFKQLLKPAKTPGLGANALPQKIATFVIPAKSMIRLHGVRIIVLY